MSASVLKRHWHVLLLGLLLAVLLALTLEPYGGNVTALFHIDRSIADTHPQPPGTVVLTIPGYDGMEYWQVARNIPSILSPSRWNILRGLPPGPYAHQRILLPVAAFVLSLGSDALLPWAFLAINVVSLLASCIVMTDLAGGRKLYGLALALCPSALVALHFMLAEPLNILLLTLFLRRFFRLDRIDWICALLLAGCALSREVNLLFILGTGAWCLWRRRWTDLAWIAVPLGAFLALHGLIYAIFGVVPFLWSAEKSTLPLKAVIELLSGAKGYNRYTLSSIGLFLLFVLPVGVRLGIDLLRAKRVEFLPAMLLAFLGLMLLMPDHIWGSITSIGRVITPVYPLFFADAGSRDRAIDRMTAAAVALLGLGASIGLALIAHPFVIA